MPKTPTLSDVIRSHINYELGEVHTSIPGRIITYDPNTQKADVQPLIKKRYQDNVVQEAAVIYQAPVVFPSSGTGILSFPIQIGDPVLILFSERSLDLWINSSPDNNGKVRDIDPQDTRRHALSDVMCIPGVHPFKSALGGHPTNTVIRMNSGVNNEENAGENAVHLHPVGDTDAIVSYANRYTDQLSTIKQLQDGSIQITSDEGNDKISTVHLKADGSILIDSSEGTNIEMVQGGKITINTPTEVEVNCETADVNTGGNATVTAGGDVDIDAGGNCTIDASQVEINGSAEKMLTDASINHVTGLPQGSGVANVKSSGGST